MFLYCLFFIIQYLWLILFYSNLYNSERISYEYEMHGKKRQSTIYKKKTDEPKKNLLLFISGAYNLELHPYIIKTMNDIESYLPEISNKYDMVCYENKHISSIIKYDDVAHYIQKWYDERFPQTPSTTTTDSANTTTTDSTTTTTTDSQLPEITLIGYSAGGVIASHIMSRIKHLPAKFKLITYDTPWQIRDNVDAFSQYTFYRLDAVFFYKVYLTYLWHYNADQLASYLQNMRVGYRWNGSKEMFELIQNIHQYDDDEFYHNTGFNFDQSPALKVINIYNRYDPLVVRSSHNSFYENNKNKIMFENQFIEKKIVGHCSDMAFSSKYLTILASSIL
jgi:hypothetical protein